MVQGPITWVVERGKSRVEKTTDIVESGGGMEVGTVSYEEMSILRIRELGGKDPESIVAHLRRRSGSGVRSLGSRLGRKVIVQFTFNEIAWNVSYPLTLSPLL